MKITRTFSSFSVADLEKAKQFYGEVIGLVVKEKEGMGLELTMPGGGKVFIYPKDNHEPATFTVLNLVVKDIDAAVDELAERGVTMERYDLGEFEPDEKGIYRSDDPERGPTIAWFTDPAGNVLSLIEDDNTNIGKKT